MSHHRVRRRHSVGSATPPCVSTPGTATGVTKQISHSYDHLLHLLNDSIRSIPGVRALETFVYLKLVKQTYTWEKR
jgi:Lrp/AsnC family transcriptional regulator, regulator for asnA, asnC and gidA